MKSIPLCSLLASMALVGCNSNEPAAVAPAASAPVAQAVDVPPAAEVAPAQAPPPGRSRAVAPVPPRAGDTPLPAPIYSDYRPPLSQPVPIAVPWAPPPMRVEVPPPPPSVDARWTGGYWVWHDSWVWAPGRWAEPPRPQYHWVPPYYEHRRDRVVFVDGFWSPPDVSFKPPARDLAIALAVVGVGIALGRAPVGPEGVFVPPPPGSRSGLFVMAPVGTAPAVVTGAPPIGAPGMRVVNNVDRSRITTNISNTTVINNITNVTIEAPAGSTLDHRPVRVSVPAQAHLAAALPPIAASRQALPPPAVPARDHEPAMRSGSTASTNKAGEPSTSRTGVPAVPAAPPLAGRAPLPTQTRLDGAAKQRPAPEDPRRTAPPPPVRADPAPMAAPGPQTLPPPARGEVAVPPKAAPAAVAPSPTTAAAKPQPPRVESRAQERPLPQAETVAPKAKRPGDPPAGETVAHGPPPAPPGRTPEARAAEAAPPGRLPAASLDKPKGESAKSEAPKAPEPRKAQDAREEAAKRKERETKGEPLRQ